MTSDSIKPIGYTMEEAAQRLRIGRRNLQELVKDHPYYYSNGARKLFTEDDINSLVQVMRRVPHAPRVSPLNRVEGRGMSRSEQEMVAVLRQLTKKRR